MSAVRSVAYELTRSEAALVKLALMGRAADCRRAVATWEVSSALGAIDQSVRDSWQRQAELSEALANRIQREAGVFLGVQDV